MILGKGMKYQRYNEQLGKRLQQVFRKRQKKLLIGINNVIDLKYAEKYNDFANNFWRGCATVIINLSF